MGNTLQPSVELHRLSPPEERAIPTVIKRQGPDGFDVISVIHSYPNQCFSSPQTLMFSPITPSCTGGFHEVGAAVVVPSLRWMLALAHLCA